MAVVVIRTVAIYILLIAAMRIMGKRQLSEMQPTELVVTLMIADLAVIPMQEVGIPLLYGAIPILILLVLELLISGAMLKLPALSRLISGNPLIIVKDGKLDQQALKRMRLSVEDLFESLRSQGIFDLKEIEYAIAETNGNISVLQKPAYRTANCKDLKLSPKDTGIPVVVVSDGQICRWALTLCQVDEAWIRKTLEKEHRALRDVFLMTCDKSHRYLIVEKEETGQ